MGRRKRPRPGPDSAGGVDDAQDQDLGAEDAAPRDPGEIMDDDAGDTDAVTPEVPAPSVPVKPKGRAKSPTRYAKFANSGG